MSYIATYSIAPATQRNLDFSVIFSSDNLVGSEKVLTHTHTHTHTHRHLASSNTKFSFAYARAKRAVSPVYTGIPRGFSVPLFMPFCQELQEENNDDLIKENKDKQNEESRV